MMLPIHIGWPQTIWLVLFVIGNVNSVYSHGKPKSGFEDGASKLIASLLALGLLIWGGFFSANC